VPDILDEQVERIAGHLKKLTKDQGRRLVTDAYQYGFGAFRRDPAARPTAVKKELEAIQNALSSAADGFDKLSNQGWIFLGVGEKYDRERLLEPLRNLQERVEGAIVVARERAVEVNDSKGGRYADDRIRSCVSSLAEVYRIHIGQPITHTFSTEDSSQTSPFDRFVLACFREFYNAPLPSGAIDSAIRNLQRPLEDSK
jgi:hypothetical protein